MAMKMATEIKMCLGPNGFSDFLAGFKSLSLRQKNSDAKHRSFSILFVNRKGFGRFADSPTYRCPRHGSEPAAVLIRFLFFRRLYDGLWWFWFFLFLI